MKIIDLTSLILTPSLSPPPSRSLPPPHVFLLTPPLLLPRGLRFSTPDWTVMRGRGIYFSWSTIIKEKIIFYKTQPSKLVLFDLTHFCLLLPQNFFEQFLVEQTSILLLLSCKLQSAAKLSHVEANCRHMSYLPHV